LPIAASQLIELSKRDAVVDSVISGPKKLSNGTAPAFQPALIGGESPLHRWREVAIAHTTASVEEKLVVRCHQHIDAWQFVGNWECADELRAINEHNRPDVSSEVADCRNIGTVAGRGLHAAERD
jgi:hypothetical protein